MSKSLRDFPVDELLKKYNHTYTQYLEYLGKRSNKYYALAFIFSIDYLIKNSPEELPDDIREYVQKAIEAKKIPYDMTNKYDKLEKGLKELGYELPKRSNGDRDIVYTRIREAGYSHLRFAQEICKKVRENNKKFANAIDKKAEENKWKKIVEKVILAEAYGDEAEINEIRQFFLNLTQSNFDDSFIEIGYSQAFADNLKKRLTASANKEERSAWQLLDADLDIEYRDQAGELYFVMPKQQQFPTEDAERLEFKFIMLDDNHSLLNNAPVKCYYKKIPGTDIDYQRIHMDAEVPVAKCFNVMRNDKNVFPKLLENYFVIWDITDNKRCTKLNLSAEKEYAICPTALFDSKSNCVKVYDKSTDKSEEVSLPYKLTGNKNIIITISCDQEYEITFARETSLLDYSKILDFSPDKRKYRYFSADKHPFKDDDNQVSGDDQVEITCGNEKINFCLKDWQLPRHFLSTRCKISIKGEHFHNIVFFPKKMLDNLKNTLEKEEYLIGKNVEIYLANKPIKFPKGVSHTEIKYKDLPITLKIKRHGAVLKLGNQTFYPPREIKLDMYDFMAARLEFFHTATYQEALIEASVQKNDSWINYIAAHRTSCQCTKINMLNIHRAYTNTSLFAEPEVDIRLFFYKNRWATKYNTAIECPKHSLKEYICRNGVSFDDYALKITLSDYSLDHVELSNDKPKISHKISETLSKEEHRFLYCLPVEKQDGEFIKIDITQNSNSAQNALLARNEDHQWIESVSIENIFTGELANTYGVITFFVYEKNGSAKRYSPGRFLKNPADISIDDYPPLQKALCPCETETLDQVFSQPGNLDNQRFIEKVFENAEKIAAAHFFNCFFNPMRKSGRYINTSSFVFRAADYWIPAAFKKDENGNFTKAQQRLADHWDFELFGYEEVSKYLPKELSRKELIKLLYRGKNGELGRVMGSLYYSLTGINAFNDAHLSHNFTSDNLLLKSKICFLTELFERKNGEKIECGNFDGNGVLFSTHKGKMIRFDDLVFAIDQLAARIHNWKKNPHLSEISTFETWDRNNCEDPYYYTEQFLRGELIYWRSMAPQEPAFNAMRHLLLCRVAQYAKADGIEYNIQD